jgi:tetratricopeptide (TPR) repeat protein
MHTDTDLNVFEIALSDFDPNLIPEEARSPGTEKFESAVKKFYEEQLRKISAEYSVNLEHGTIRVTWRNSSMHPDALDEGVDALKRGDYGSGVQILELLAPSRPQDAMLHYNLGMAYSDLGKLSQSVEQLKKALEIDKNLVNAKVALGVSYSRLKEYEKSASILKEAVLDDPDNGYALRNLGAVLMQIGDAGGDTIRYLERAVELLPEDQQAWFGLGQAYLKAEDLDHADKALMKVIDIQPYNQIASAAKQMRSDIAQTNFRVAATGTLRIDAVMYCLAALKKFASMSAEQVRNVGFEIATVGMNGINVNDPKSEYHLRNLSGVFTGIQLLCYEYVAFKQFAPEMDIGFDLAKEYDEAIRMKTMGL